MMAIGKKADMHPSEAPPPKSHTSKKNQLPVTHVSVLHYVMGLEYNNPAHISGGADTELLLSSCQRSRPEGAAVCCVADAALCSN